MREWGSARSKPLPARTGQGAVGERAIFQSQQQQCVDEHDEESGGGAHGGIAADPVAARNPAEFFRRES